AIGIVDHMVWRVNAAACRILGRSEAELLDTTWDRLIHPDDRKKRLNDARHLVSDDRTDYQDVIRFVRPDGSVVHVLATTTILRDHPDGEPYYLSQFQDVTQEVTTHHYLRLLLENTPVTLFLMDRTGRIRFAGGEVNVSRVNTTRLSVFETFEDMPILSLARRALSGERVSGVVEARGRRYDAHVVPILAADGTVMSVAMVATDVTEREQALEELRARSAEQAIVADLGRQALNSPDPEPLWRAAAEMISDHLHADAVTVHELHLGHTGHTGMTRPHLAAAIGTPPEPGILVTSALAARGPVHADNLPGPGPQDSPDQWGSSDQRSSHDPQGSPDPQDDNQRPRSGGLRCGLAIPIGQPDNPTAILTIYRAAPTTSGSPTPDTPSPAPAPDTPMRSITSTSGSAGTSGPSSFTEREAEFVQAVATVLSAAAVRFQIERDAHHRALHDGLTGLANRTALFEHLGQTLNHDHGQTPNHDHQHRTGILFVDLDGFKNVNDSLGHHTGDRLLCEVATRLRNAVRPGDTVARLSGDEFAVVCEEITTEPALRAIAERVVTALSKPVILDGRHVTVTASVGVALSGPDIPDPDGLLRAADIAMYGAKHQGRGRYLLFDETMRSEALDRLTTENDLRHALTTNDLRLHYQPVINADGNVVGAEALLRWQHPERGLLYPEAFLPLAEETGIIVSLGRWVLHTACHAAASWTPGPPPACPPHISVNVSARQLTDPHFLPDLAALLRTTNADHRYQLCLEITENTLIDDSSTVSATLQAAHALGVTLYIDDFGSGHSSLTRLHRLPLDGLKIDRRFISRMTEDPADHAIVAAVIHLAHILGLTAIAEGVETSEQLAALTDLRCDLVQGYHLARPEPHLPTLQPTATACRP
uniref:sensor domain-containing protein n=1 Tax=Candidatus Protofrankia californiensis TaxID=1839754 RepID=UPI0010417D72